MPPITLFYPLHTPIHILFFFQAGFLPTFLSFVFNAGLLQVTIVAVLVIAASIHVEVIPMERQKVTFIHSDVSGKVKSGALILSSS